MNDFDTEFMNVSFLPYSVLLKQVLVCIWLGVTVTIWEECQCMLGCWVLMVMVGGLNNIYVCENSMCCIIAAD